MRTLLAFAFILLLAPASAADPLPSSAPGIVIVPSGKLHLRGWLFRPQGAERAPAVLFLHGSGGGDPDHTAGLTMETTAERLGPVFAKRGYVFLYLCRRGQGLS